MANPQHLAPESLAELREIAERVKVYADDLDAIGWGFAADTAQAAADLRALLTALSSRQAEVARLREALRPLVEEFGSTIEQYHKLGPHFTFKDGTEVFDVGVILDRAELIETARTALKDTTDET